MKKSGTPFQYSSETGIVNRIGWHLAERTPDKSSSLRQLNALVRDRNSRFEAEQLRIAAMRCGVILAVNRIVPNYGRMPGPTTWGPAAAISKGSST
jgi:hypothetical protein